MLISENIQKWLLSHLNTIKWSAAKTPMKSCVVLSVSPIWSSSSSCISLPHCQRPHRAAGRSLWWRADIPGTRRTAWGSADQPPWPAYSAGEGERCVSVPANVHSITGARSTLRDPKILLPHDETNLIYLGIFFNFEHFYVPVINLY